MKQILFKPEYSNEAPRNLGDIRYAVEAAIHRRSLAEGQLEAVAEQVDNVTRFVSRLVEKLNASGKLSDEELQKLLGEEYSIVDHQIPVDKT